MYISPVDILEISVDELMNLDSKGLIRLEKRLRIQKLQNKSDDYNPQQFDALLTQLADDSKKSSIFFVEKHPRLKKFVSSGKDDGTKTFIIDQRILDQAPHIKEFLAPYFDAYFMRLVKQDYQAKKYDTIIQAMKYKGLFTDQLLTKYYEYIKGQIKIVVERIVVARKGKLTTSVPEITYKTLIELMNTVPLGFIRKTKMAYVNALVDYYNSTLNKYSEFSKIQRAFRNITDIEIGDQNFIAYFKKLSNQISNTSVTHHNTRASTSSSSGWRTVAIIFGILIFIARVSRIFKGSSNDSPSYNTTINYPTITVSFDEDKTAFYSDLIHKAKDTLNDQKIVEITSDHNAYPFQFENIRVASKFGTKGISVHNKRDNPVILFLQENGVLDRSRSTSIIAQDSLSILGLKKNSILVFYAGDEFTAPNGSFRFVKRNGSVVRKRPKRYFKTVSEIELGWLKSKFIIDSVGTNPKIDLIENNLVFHNVYYHEDAHVMLPEEPVEVEEMVIESTSAYETSKTKESWRFSKEEFFNSLSNGGKTTKETTTLANGDNPYPKLFKSADHTSINGYNVLVHNATDEDLIIFSRNLPLERDQAAFITKNHNINIRLHDQNDTLYFYKGNEFFKANSTQSHDLKSSSPEGYFSEVSAKSLNLVKKPFVIQGLGSDPTIQVTNTDIFFNQITYKKE